jgi:hypothetical protein
LKREGEREIDKNLSSYNPFFFFSFGVWGVNLVQSF